MKYLRSWPLMFALTIIPVASSPLMAQEVAAKGIAKYSGSPWSPGTVTFMTTLEQGAYLLKGHIGTNNYRIYNSKGGHFNDGPDYAPVFSDTDNTWGDGEPFHWDSGEWDSVAAQTVAVDTVYAVLVGWQLLELTMGRKDLSLFGSNLEVYVHRLRQDDEWPNLNRASHSGWIANISDGVKYDNMSSMDLASQVFGEIVALDQIYAPGHYNGVHYAPIALATAEIFGAMAEFYEVSGAYQAKRTEIPDTDAITSSINTFQGRVPAANYLIGERVETLKKPYPIRHMYKPSDDTGGGFDAYDPTDADFQNATTFQKGGPAVHFFFLLAHGSRVDAWSGHLQSPMWNDVKKIRGIGNQKATLIWYAACERYSIDDYPSARIATLAAAETLYGPNSREWNAVNLAWRAVNVLPPQ